ncbi:MAG: hypothetical protein WD991_01185 [Candidatus Paceibacterota bacterium]
MDQQELQKNIALYYSKLSPEAQIVFSGMKWLDMLKKISIKYGLTETQSRTLGSETTLIMLGMIPMLEYEQNLAKDLAMPRENLELMITEIKSALLNPIATHITKAYENNVETETKERDVVESELDERFKKLPEDIKNAIIESNYYDNLYQIAQKYGLNIRQTGLLEEAVTSVMTGVLSPDKLEGTVKERTGTTPDIAGQMVIDINEKILKPVRTKMMQKTDKPPITSIKINRVTPEKTEETKLKHSEEFILNNAGIKINPQKLNALELGSGKQEVKTPPATPATPPVGLSQKLSGISQTPVVTTEHTIENITKIDKKPDDIIRKIPKTDPYREIPE